MEMSEPTPNSSPITNTSISTVTEEFVIKNQAGLHARPCALLSKVVGKYHCDVTVEKDGTTEPAKDAINLMMLAAGCGSKIKVTCTGDTTECQNILKEIGELVENHFGLEQKLL
jgi:phosphocarrier protein HPr